MCSNGGGKVVLGDVHGSDVSPRILTKKRKRHKGQRRKDKDGSRGWKYSTP